MLDRLNQHRSRTEALVAQLKEEARHLYLSRRFLCAEAVMVTLNKGLGGDLSESQAGALAAPFSVAMGQSGCICGALSGAVLACGQFLGNNRRSRTSRAYARQLHDSFKTANGATCCRVLTRKVKHDKQAHFQQCADLTADTTEMAAILILHKRPELIAQAGNDLLLRRYSKIGDTMTRLLRFFHNKKILTS